VESELQLSESEWQLMKVLWEIAPASVNQIAEITSHWHPKTVRTMLIRLDKKGVVGFTLDNGIQHYAPKLTREECEAQATESFLQRVFNGALTPMVAHFSRSRKLTVEEREALLNLLNDKE